MTQLDEKIGEAVKRLRAFEPPEGYYLAFSGGKDSVVCKALCDLAGVKYDAHYRVTSVDPPELVKFIKEQHPDVSLDVPKDKSGKPITMWTLIPRKRIPPTRLVRYCCAELKETGGDGRKTITGVRWAESTARKRYQGAVKIVGGARLIADNPDFSTTPKGGYVLTNDNEDARKMVEMCVPRAKVCVNPIIDWTDDEVWEFIRAESIPYCGLYDCGMKRLGCIGCPMAGKKARELELARWSSYKSAYLRAFERMLEARRQRGMPTNWQTPRDVMRWWMRYDVLPGQMSIFEEYDDEW